MLFFRKSRGMLTCLAIILVLLSSKHLDAECDSTGSTITESSEYDPNSFQVELSGPSIVVSPGGYQYTVTGGLGMHIWSVSGTEGQSDILIDENGYVTLRAATCGSYVVTVRDSNGQEASKAVRIINEGGKGGWYWFGVLYGCWSTTENCHAITYSKVIISGNMIYDVGYGNVDDCVSSACEDPAMAQCVGFADGCPATSDDGTQLIPVGVWYGEWRCEKRDLRQ